MAIDELDQESLSNIVVTGYISGKTLIVSTYDHHLFADGFVPDGSIKARVGDFFQCKYVGVANSLENGLVTRRESGPK